MHIKYDGPKAPVLINYSGPDVKLFIGFCGIPGLGALGNVQDLRVLRLGFTLWFESWGLIIQRLGIRVFDTPYNVVLIPEP